MNSRTSKGGKAPSRISLRVKLTLLAIAVSAIPIAVVTMLFISQGESALETNMREHFFTIIDRLGSEVDTALAKGQTGLAVVGHSLTAEELSDDERVALAAAQVSAHGLPWVALYDASGTYIDTISTEGGRGRAPERIDRELAERARADGEAIGGARKTDNIPELLVAAPVRGEATTWIALTAVPLEPVQAAIERLVDRRHFGELYRIYVLDNELTVIAHSDRELAQVRASLADSEVLRLIGGKAPERNNVLIFRDKLETDGGDVVVAIATLQNLPWLLVVELPREVAFREFARMRIEVIVAVLIVILIAVVAGVFLARRITQPIKRLVGFAADLAARKFDARVDIDTRDELSILGDALSSAASELEASEKLIREEEAIRADLGRYLPSQLVNQIVAREQKLGLGGERRQITVMFADVAGFTPLAEKNAAEDVVTILNELFTILTEIVFRHGGTVDKFVGDCIMAFWNAPEDQPDHARRAVEAAEEMLRWLELGNDTWRERFDVEISLAIGVHTGEAVVGNFGSETRMDYTAIGDVVNVAARLEARARPSQILITGATRELAGARFRYIELGAHPLAGKSAPIELFEVQS